MRRAGLKKFRKMIVARREDRWSVPTGSGASLPSMGPGARGNNTLAPDGTHYWAFCVGFDTVGGTNAVIGGGLPE